MKTYISKACHAGMMLAVALLLAVGFASCGNDDAVTKTPLYSPALTAGDKTVSTLSFSWNKVEGATQYACKLYTADGTYVCGNVVTQTNFNATGLLANTEYVLKVWAYAAIDGDNSTSPTVELTATTNDYTQLDHVAGVTSGSASGVVTITWPEVEHATGYRYEIYDSNNNKVVSDSTSTNSFSEALDFGTYTVSLVACSSDENYSDSEPVTFQFKSTKGELWRRTGTYTCAALNQTFEAEIVAYQDGTYEIFGPYGDDTYSLKFKKDPTSNTQIVITNVDIDSYGYYNFWVSSSYWSAAYCKSNYSQLTGDADGGELWFWSYLYDASSNSVGSGYDDFVWGGEEETGDEIPSDCKSEVSPLLTTTWWQYAPYNNLTPTLDDGSHAATGCMATALAQIMYYYKYPAAYADGTTIDWDNMLPTYTGVDYTEAQGTAVATLMSKIGVAVNMTYGASSTSYASAVERGIPSAFGYKVKYYGYRDSPTEKDATKWKSIIFHELSAGHPVLYGGTSYKNGTSNAFSHAFVIDGYNAEGFVHVNYGFGGNGDAWVTIDKMSMTGISGWRDENFDTYQTLTVLHQPADGDIDYDL